MAISPLPQIEKNTSRTADGVAESNEKLYAVNSAINKQTGVLSDYIQYLKSESTKAGLLSNNKTNSGSGGAVAGIGALKGASEAVGGALAGLGGILGGAGAAVLGAGTGILGASFPVLAAGIASFANPFTIGGAAVITGFFLGLAGVTWIFGKGLQAVGTGFSDIGKGIEDLGKAGDNTDTESLKAAGEGITAFLTEVGDNIVGGIKGAAVLFLTGDLSKIATGLDSLNTIRVDEAKLKNAGDALSTFLTTVGGGGIAGAFGAVVTFLTGDLTKIATGLGTLNTINVDKTNLENAALSLNTFFKTLSTGSLWDTIKGSISTSLTPDMTALANSLSAMSVVTFDLKKFQDMAVGMNAISGPLADFAGSGILGNFVGKQSLTDLADGLTALNGAQTNNLGAVSTGFVAVNDGLWEFTKTGLAANFVGKTAITDLADGLTALNKAEVGNLVTVNAGLDVIKENLRSYTATGFLANFVGKTAITDLTDAASDMNERLGADGQLQKAQNANAALLAVKDGLMSFAKAGLVSSLAGVATAVFDFFAGDKNPITQAMEIAENADELTKGANALGSIADNLNKFGAINFDGDKFNIKGFAEDLKSAVPIIEGAIMGDNGGWFGKKVFGLASPEIDYKKAAESIDILKTALKVDSVAEGASSGSSSAVSSIVNNYITNNYTTNNGNKDGGEPTKITIREGQPVGGRSAYLATGRYGF